MIMTILTIKRSATIVVIFFVLVAHSYCPSYRCKSSSIVFSYAKHHEISIHEKRQSNLVYSVKEFLQISDNDFIEIRERIKNRIDKQIQEDLNTSGLVKEEQQYHLLSSTIDEWKQVPDYEWIFSQNDKNQKRPFAVRSLQPLLNRTSIAGLRNEAETAWYKGQTSRFTYQRPGNYEVHITDLSSTVKDIVNNCLQTKIYPWVQSVFGPIHQQLSVYDALIIRYNATEATQKTGGPGAGQPLHRDMGLVSINIMLNDDFIGGGTFFENQMASDTAGDRSHELQQPLKPLGIGHALAHYSSERHAGSATLQGVRDILVIFITADESPVQSAILKQCRNYCQTQNANDIVGTHMCRIYHQLMAIEITPQDGEAWQYLGSALMELSGIPSLQESRQQQQLLQYALECFEIATLFAACDSRIYNNMGLVYARLSKLLCSKDVAVSDKYSKTAEHAYQKGWQLLSKSELAGCDVTSDFDALALNYGLHMANQDRFADACTILERTAFKVDQDPENQIVNDAHKLLTFCQKNTQQ